MSKLDIKKIILIVNLSGEKERERIKSASHIIHYDNFS